MVMVQVQLMVQKAVESQVKVYPQTSNKQNKKHVVKSIKR